MRNIFRLSAALASLAAIACTNDMIEPDANGQANPSGNLVPMVLSSGPVSKTSLDGNDVRWTDDDVIAVFDNLNAANKFAAVSVDGSNAVFEGLVAEGTTDFYAVYPFDKAVKATSSDIVVNLPADQTPAAGTFAEEHNVSIAQGVKTPGKEEVKGITFRNLCALVHFTVPERLAAVSEVSFTADNRPLAGQLTVSKSDIQTIASVADGRNTVTMKGSFAAGSTFYFVVAPGDVNGFSIKVTAANGAQFSKTSSKSFSVAAGAMKNLGVIDFTPAPSAKAVHSYPGGVLSGTDVTLAMGLPAGMEEYVQSVSASIKNASGTEIRSYEGAPSSTGNLTLSVQNGWTYIPQGDYTIDYSYTINGVTDNKTVSVKVPAPQFNVYADAATSYTEYKTKGKDAGNVCGPKDIYDIRCSVSISAAVLNQIKLTSWSASILNSSGSDILAQSSETHNTQYSDPSVFYSNEHMTSNAVGAYSLSAKATFDGVTVDSAVKDIPVTGLPYKASQMVESDWKLKSWNCEYSNGTIQLGGVSGSGEATATSQMALHIPASIPIIVNTNVTVKALDHRIYWFGEWKGAMYNTTFTLKVNDGSAIISVSSYSNEPQENGINHSLSGTSTFTPSGSSIKMNSSYEAAGPWSKVHSMEILYN